MIDALLSLIAPFSCVSCNKEGSALCSDCAQKIPKLPSRCFRCYKLTANNATCNTCRSRTHVSRAYIVSMFSGTIKELIHNYKLEHKRAISKNLAILLQQTYSVPRGELVTYIPTLPLHVRQRGFDHAKSLAKSYSKIVGTPTISLLRRQKQSIQTGSSRLKRLQNSQNLFSVIRPALVKGKTVYVIDDVVTTGATVSAAAIALKRAGARSVCVLAIAYTPPQQ